MKVSPNIQVIQAQFDSPKLKPSYAHGVGDAGCDMRANITEPKTIFPSEIVKFGTGIHLAMPNGMFALQAIRSGLSINHGLQLANAPGIIDSDYRGEIVCALVNMSAEPYTVEPFERIGQLIFLAHYSVAFEEVERLPQTSRGDSGFGSSGRF